MKVARLLIFLCFWSIFANLYGQSTGTHFPERKSGWLTLGLNGGWAYQSADVRTSLEGWGAGLTLGKNVFYRPGALLSVDVRGRGLFARSYGYDTRRSFNLDGNEALNGKVNLDYMIDQTAPPDSSFVYHNFRNGLGELGLEGVFTFNRLRERRGVVLSLFGGIGLDAYTTRYDQADARGDIYNYFSVSANASASTVCDQLDALRDGHFETRAEQFTEQSVRFGWMPGAGIELGYQLGRNVVIGVAHKLTFSRTDLLDGQRWASGTALSTDKDLHHYTSFFLAFDIERRQRQRMQPPVIEVIRPASRQTVLAEGIPIDVQARIRNVYSVADVQMTLNGSRHFFDFRQGTLSSDLRLRPGRNEIRLSASNPVGRDEETLVIIVESAPPPPPPPPPPSSYGPELRITQPGSSPLTTNRSEAAIIAIVRNVRNQRDVRLLVNGRETAFSLAEGLEATVPLREGKNIVRVEANTPDGRASDEVEILYEPVNEQGPPARRPVVRITQPATSREKATDRTYTLKASVDNVTVREEVSVYVDKNALKTFEFNPRTGALTADLTLRRGDNEVTVRATNSAGTADEIVVITLTEPPSPVRLPEITVYEPTDNQEFTQADMSLRAVVRNITDRSNIDILVNGAVLRAYEYNKVSLSVNARVTLRPGENTILIKASNKDGNDEKTLRVRYNPPQKPPTVRITEPAASGAASNTLQKRVKATAENISSKSEITFEVNGAPTAFSFNTGSGLIEADVNLKPGDNKVSIKVTNRAGSDQASTTIRYASAPLPAVTISAPENKSVTDNPAAVLKAVLENAGGSKNVQVSQNGKALSGFVLDKTGGLNLPLQLQKGANRIRVKAVTEAGSAEAEVSVTYNPPAEPKPELLFTQPKKAGAKSAEAAYTVKATAKYVQDKKQLRVTLNGKPVKSFDFAKNVVTVKLTLAEGKNTVKIEAENASGAASVSTDITFEKSGGVSRPEITVQSVTQPTVNPLNPNQGRTTVTGKILHITEKDQISVKVNGAAFSNINFEASTGAFNFVASLVKGENTIEITATNTAGSDTVTRKVVF